MPYSLWRGPRRLGRIELPPNDDPATGRDVALIGFLVVEAIDPDLRSEMQSHFPADGDTPAFVARMPCEVQLISRALEPARARTARRGQKFETTNKVDPGDELRVFQDDRVVRARSVWLCESRFTDDWAKSVARALPPGALYGDSQWLVTAWLEVPLGGSSSRDTQP